MNLSNDICYLGFSLSEYQRMFALTDEDLSLAILDCAAGASSFNAELTATGGQVVSIDPVYELPTESMHQRFSQRFDNLFKTLAKHKDEYNWQNYGTFDRFKCKHLHAIDQFYGDYQLDELHRRYNSALLPALPFKDYQFDMALCSHFLLTRRAGLSLEFLIEAVMEMCRVACEARIFPLVDETGQLSKQLEPLIRALKKRSVGVSIEQVDFELQTGDNAMLKVWNFDRSVN